MSTPNAHVLNGEKRVRYDAIVARLNELDTDRLRLAGAIRDLRDSYGDKVREQRQTFEQQLEAVRAEAQALQAEQAPLTALKELDDMLDAKVRPYVGIAREVARVAPAEVTDALKIVLGALLEVGEGLTEESNRFAKLRARTCRVAIEAYTAQGFSREEALQLLLADKVATQSFVGSARRNRKG